MFSSFFFLKYESSNSFKIFVFVICLMTRWIINLFLIFSRISSLTFLFFFHFLFRLNLTMYEHFLKECSSSHMHFSFFFWWEWLFFLLLFLLIDLCSFWLNDSFLTWSWVTSCRVAALAVSRNDDVEFSLITTSLYARVILKKSTDFSAVFSWFSQLSQNVDAHLRSARRNSLTNMTSSSKVSASFKLIIWRRKFFHSTTHDSTLSLIERIFKSLHCSCIYWIILLWSSLYLAASNFMMIRASDLSSFDEIYWWADVLIALFIVCSSRVVLS